MLMRVLLILSVFLAFPFIKVTNAQTVYLPYSHASYQKLSPLFYHPDSSIHTAFKPTYLDTTLSNHLHKWGVESPKTTWAGRKLWNEHFVDIRHSGYSFYADILPDMQIGRSIHDGTQTWSNNWGIQIGSIIGNQLHMYGSFFYNQTKHPTYIGRYIAQQQVIPGQQHVVMNPSNDHYYNWSDFTAGISYNPNRYLNVSLAYDKNFIGDGYRSLLLSDISSNYLALKLTGTIGKVQYTSMWTHMHDPFASKMPIIRADGTPMDIFNTHKFGVFQFLDWNASPRFSVGIFQSVLWAPKNESGRRGFDFNYVNPLIFMRAVELTNTSSPDKMHLGINARYKLSNQLASYGQFLLGEFTAKEFFAGNGYVHNKFAIQLGLRGYDIFGVNRLNFLAEFNMTRPHTYQHFTEITAYTNYNQPLAHYLGANFREGVFIVNYGYKRLDFQSQVNWALYGKDPNAETNYGGNIFKSYYFPARYYGNEIGQGLTTHLTFADFTASYLINPKHNLRIEASATSRKEWNNAHDHSTLWIKLGIRSSFRNIYTDL